MRLNFLSFCFIRRYVFLSFLFSSIFFSHCDDDPAKKTSPYPLADENGINGRQLATAFTSLRSSPAMKALLVGRNGVIVAEEYLNGMVAAEPQEVRSVTKSVVSILIGIAVDKKHIASIDQSIADYLGDVVEEFPQDKRAITIRHLLTMTGGFTWTEFGDWSEYSNWANAPNQVNYILAKQLAWQPGGHFNYNDGACHLLSVILTQATGMSTYEFAQQNLFTPLGFAATSWTTDRQGFSRGCTGLTITARDMFKLGELMRHGGIANDVPVVSAEWIDQSTRAQVATGGVMMNGSNYGFLWWVDTVRGRPCYMATGFGGQFIYCAPSLNLVIVAQCNWQVSEQSANQNWMAIMQAIQNDILPAVQ